MTIDRATARLFHGGMTDERFYRVIDSAIPNVRDADSIWEYFIRRQERRFFFSLANREATVSLIQKHFPSSSSVIISAADNICAHRFDLLGSSGSRVRRGIRDEVSDQGESTDQRSNGSTGPGHYEPIDWHMDFKTGYRWNSSLHFGEIEIPYGKADIKVPWELSRFQHLVTLGQSFWLTDDYKYSREFRDQISDWIEHNPVRYGVNWACTMDVAIRAINWIMAFSFFGDTHDFPSEFKLAFIKSFFLHGRFIRKNLEFSYNELGEKIALNHYLSDVVGLLFLGLFFEETKEGKEWLDFGLREIVSQMECQVHHDGGDFESSIPYQRLVLEFFAASSLLCNLNHIELPPLFWERLERMFELVMHYSKPDGEAPQIGDNDSGRLWILSNYGNWNLNDHRYLLAIGSLLCERGDFGAAAGSHQEEVIWLHGEKGWADLNAIKAGAKGDALELGSRVFPQSGYYIMRDRDNYTIISAGRVGSRGLGNHKHNDDLSFELCADGKTFIVDPGTYSYTAHPEMRDLFRSVASHNIVQIDNEETNELVQDDLFRIRERALLTVTRWETTEDQDNFCGELSVNNCTIQREILFLKTEQRWIITDRIVESNGGESSNNGVEMGGLSHEMVWRFHFHPAVRIELDDHHTRAKAFREDNELQLAATILERDGVEGGRFAVERGWFSPGYGLKEATSVLNLRLRAKFPITLTFSITAC